MTQQKPWYRQEYLFFLFCLLLAFVLRLILLVHTNGVIDGDEALVGIQAEHILRGEHPTYFYGQAYMGSVEAYLMAGLFSIFGPSAWMLRAEPLLISLLVIWCTWKLAHALANEARLAERERLYFQCIATLCAAIAPLYGAVAELRALGGYIETYVMMLLLLLLVLRLTQQWRASASYRVFAFYWAAIGFLVGLGFWVYPQIIVAVAVVGLWIIGYCITALVFRKHLFSFIERFQILRRHTGHKTLRESLDMLSKGFIVTPVALPFALIGSAPALVWGASNYWRNVRYLLMRSGISSPKSIHSLADMYLGCVAPRIISGSLPGEGFLSVLLHTLPLYLGFFCIGCSIFLLALSLVWHHPLLLQARRLALLPLLFGISSYLFFLISWGTAWCWERDIVGRYAASLTLVLPFFIATVLTIVYAFLRNRVENNGDEAAQPRFLRCIFASPRFARIVQSLVLSILILSLGTQAISYAFANPGLTFQSPFCRDAPAHTEPIITYMESHHIYYVWANFWLGNPIVFKTYEHIIVGDPGVATSRIPGRTHQYGFTVEQADRASFLVFANVEDTHPAILRLLDSLHVTYRIKLFPSEPGVNVLLVTPLNRTVSLLESPQFKDLFPTCPSRWGPDIPDIAF